MPKNFVSDISMRENSIRDVAVLHLAGGVGNLGELTFNANDETFLAFIGSPTTTTHQLKVGYELLVNVRNETGSTINRGDVVYATGSSPLEMNRILVSPFLATGVNPHLVLGVAVEDIPNSSNGKVTSFGPISNLNTAGWSEGTILYPSSSVPGGLTNIQPTGGTNQSIAIAIVTKTDVSSGAIFVRFSPSDLNASTAGGRYLGVVDATLSSGLPSSPSDGDLWLVSVAGRFENSPLVYQSGVYFEVGSTIRWSTHPSIGGKWVKVEGDNHITPHASGAGSIVNLAVFPSTPTSTTLGDFWFESISGGYTILRYVTPSGIRSVVLGDSLISNSQITGVGNTNATLGRTFYPMNANAGAQTVTLPDPVLVSHHISIKKIDSSANVVTVLPNNTENIEGDPSPVSITVQGESLTFMSDGANWWIV